MSDNETQQPVCFIIMPISDSINYPPGHFKRVYEYLIKPACERAGFVPLRADDIKGTNVIVIDILKRIISSEMAVCDLSSKNPNVLYELGIRQSFDLPVTLIKDDITERIFDIQGFRDVMYSNSLRIDEVEESIDSIAGSIRETYENKGKDVNSIIELLGLSKASLKETVVLSNEASILLEAINDVKDRLATIKDPVPQAIVRSLSLSWDSDPKFKIVHLDEYATDDIVLHPKFGKGKVKNIDRTGKEPKITILFDTSGEKVLLMSFAKLKKYI